jgi:hypothetical protein
MATFTPRLNLIKPLTSELMSAGDRHLADNYRVIDAATGVYEGTSFPGSPYYGLVVRRTDLSKTYFWNNVSWVEWGGVSGAPGLANGDAAISSPVVTTFTSEAAALSLSFSAVQNRRYLIKASGTFEFTSNVEGSFRTSLRWKVGVSVPTGSDSLIREFRHYDDAADVLAKPVSVMEEFNYTSISQTISLAFLFRSEGVASITCGQHHSGPSNEVPQTALTIYDYGA